MTSHETENWPRIVVICVILQARMISADDFFADLLSGHVSTIILMRMEFFFNGAFTITQSRKI